MSIKHTSLLAAVVYREGIGSNWFVIDANGSPIR